MLRHSYHPLVLAIIGLAILGIGIQLFNRPGAFITQILVTVGIVAILIFVMKTFILPRIMRNRSPFGQAAHTSNRPTAKRAVPFSNKKKDKKKTVSRPLIKRQSNVKLTVIEGKKNKKKNRALF
ncbi:SA1362 family protein [Evansella sp. AB-P1]|uniref:SA1362 family protein n=1 Tax=Evansella sp. AB-P1 TaxID=3037653 RepID=UPI00241BFDE9|nr:SA1362 family protein [Evansella sp. AB-P1]MDG5788707.1 SA1362 family protein [Evansella sp. AB-P1]